MFFSSLMEYGFDKRSHAGYNGTMKFKGIALALLSVFFIFSCATTGKEKPAPDAVAPDKPAQGQPAQEPTESVGEQGGTETGAAAVSSDTGDQVTVEPAGTEDAASPETTEDTAGLIKATEEGAIAVSEEVFAKTFSDIEAFIANLSRIIKDEKYDEWVNFLSKDYIDTYSDPEKLSELSKQPLLQKYNVKLRSLKDYFTYVVVQSRTNATLDDLVFLSQERVKAISVINGQRVILYLLEKTNGSWKIGTL